MKNQEFKRKNGTYIQKVQKRPEETIWQYLKRRWRESEEDVLKFKDKLLGDKE